MCCIIIFDRVYGNAYTEKHECFIQWLWAYIYDEMHDVIYILHALQVDYSCINRGNSAGFFHDLYDICLCA